MRAEFWLRQTEERKVWRYQRGNKKPKIKGQTMQWPNGKRTNDDLQNTENLKIGEYESHNKTVNELKCSGRESGSCTSSGTRRVTLGKILL
jgi:hypothetical protein